MECSVIEIDLTKMCQHVNKRWIQMKPSTEREDCNCLAKLTSNFVEFVCNVTRLTCQTTFYNEAHLIIHFL